MAKNDTKAFSVELLDQLLAGRDQTTVLDSGGLIAELKKALAERMLNAEMDMHLEQPGEADAGNHRNGSSAKDRPDTGRRAYFVDPAAIGTAVSIRRSSPSTARRFPGCDDKIIALYARRHEHARYPGARARAVRHRGLPGSGLRRHRSGDR